MPLKKAAAAYFLKTLAEPGGWRNARSNGGSKALVEGNTNLFTEPWPAHSYVGILNHWFGTTVFKNCL